MGRVTRVVGNTETERSLVAADTLKPSIEATCVEGHANQLSREQKKSLPQSRTMVIIHPTQNAEHHMKSPTSAGIISALVKQPPNVINPATGCQMTLPDVSGDERFWPGSLLFFYITDHALVVSIFFKPSHPPPLYTDLWYLLTVTKPRPPSFLSLGFHPSRGRSINEHLYSILL